jgi:hypothetical protein
MLVQNVITFIKIQCMFIGFKPFVQASRDISYAMLKAVNFWIWNSNKEYGFTLQVDGCVQITAIYEKMQRTK